MPLADVAWDDHGDTEVALKLYQLGFTDKAPASHGVRCASVGLAA